MNIRPSRRSAGRTARRRPDNLAKQWRRRLRGGRTADADSAACHRQDRNATDVVVAPVVAPVVAQEDVPATAAVLADASTPRAARPADARLLQRLLHLRIRHSAANHTSRGSSRPCVSPTPKSSSVVPALVWFMSPEVTGLVWYGLGRLGPCGQDGELRHSDSGRLRRHRAS